MNIEARKYHLIEQMMLLNESQIQKLEYFISDVSESELSSSLDRASQRRQGDTTRGGSKKVLQLALEVVWSDEANDGLDDILECLEKHLTETNNA